MRKSLLQRLVDFLRGIPSDNALAHMSDKALMDQINFDAADNRINTVYATEYRRRTRIKNI